MEKIISQGDVIHFEQEEEVEKKNMYKYTK